MNDVSNYDVTFWHFDNILYFQAKFGKENVRVNKVIVNKRKLGWFSPVCNDDSNQLKQFSEGELSRKEVKSWKLRHGEKQNKKKKLDKQWIVKKME